MRDNMQPKESKHNRRSPREKAKVNLFPAAVGRNLQSSRKQSMDNLPKIPDNIFQRKQVWEKSRVLSNA